MESFSETKQEIIHAVIAKARKKQKMKTLSQFRNNGTNQVQTEESVSSEYGKFDVLVRAGLANKAQLSRLHTILDKMKSSESPNLSRADRMIVTNLFNKMVDLITDEPNVFRQTKQAVMKEEEEGEDYIEEDFGYHVRSELSNLPNILVLKRKAIRLFPNGVKVATYFSDKLKRTFTLPINSDLNMSSIEGSEIK